MPEDDADHQDPESDAGDEEEEQAWQRLSPRLRGLIREELDEADKRRAAAQPKPENQEKPEKPATTEKPETPTHDDRSTAQKPRRSVAQRWFGLS